MTDLFEAGGLAEDAPRPLADRLRPKTLGDVVGQEHLIGPDGPIGRMIAANRPHSIILWGPPGTGKTTIARLLSTAFQSAFRAIVGGVFRRCRSEEDVRSRAPAPPHGAGHAALHRRDPSLQPQPAGLVPAGDGRRHHRPRRRDDGEPVFRAERRVALARAGSGAAASRRCRAGTADCSARRRTTARSCR